MNNPTTTTQSGWLNQSWAVLIVSAAMAIPLLWPTIPPLTDLLGHLGRYAIQLDGGRTPFLAENFSFKWGLMGNLGVDLLIVPMAPLFGLEFSVKLIAMITPVIGALGVFAIARQVHGRVPPTVLFALPFLYGNPFTFGFLNFSLSMAVALNALALWVWLGKHGYLRLRFILFVPISCGLWLIHSFGWGFLGLLTFALELGRAREKGAPWLEAIWNSGLQCICQALPIAAFLVWRSDAEAGGTRDWFNFERKAQWLARSLRDRWMWFDAIGMIVAVIILYQAIRSPVRRYALPLAIGALLLAVTFVILPTFVLTSAYADMRLAPYIFIVAILALKPIDIGNGRTETIWTAAAILFLVVRLGGNTVSFYLYDARYKEALAALDHLPRHSRVITFVRDRCRSDWSDDRVEHIPSLAIVRRQAFTNDQWAVPGAQLMKIIKADAPGFVEDPSQFVTNSECPTKIRPTIEKQLGRFPRAAFDYVWLLDIPGIKQDDLAGLTQVWTNGKDALYRIEHPSSARPK